MSTILGLNLTNQDDSIVVISGGLYVKTPAALETLLSELRGIGYEIDNLREEKHRLERGTSVETMEKQGWSLWFAKVDVRRGKCLSCNGIISTLGIQSHGHTCELCGAVTYAKIRDGSTVRFSFIPRDGEESGGMADIKMKAKRWDAKEGYLYFYPEVLDGLWLRGDRAKQYLDANKDKWEEVRERGRRLIRVKYPHSWDYEVSAINPSEIHGHYWNHRIVRVWQGKEYGEWGGLPIPDMLSIYEAWHWPKHKKSPTLHSTILHACGQTDDKGYHYQDGTPYFQPGHWQNMSTFIRHFTELDADKFDKAWPKFRKDGPGGIDDLANFCHKKAAVRNDPNIGSLIYGFGKVLSGEPITKGDVDAMHHAAADRPTMTEFQKVIGGMSSK